EWRSMSVTGVDDAQHGRTLYTINMRDPAPRNFFFNTPATSHIYTLSLHDALPISLAGLIVLTRNLNAIFLLVLPLYGIATLRDMRRRIGVLWQRRAALTLAAIVGISVLLPQFVLYKWTTGSWIVNSYQLLNNRFAF